MVAAAAPAAAAPAAPAPAGARRAAAHHSLEMYHPAYWIVFSATTALLFIPGNQQRRMFSLWAMVRLLGQKGKGEEGEARRKRGSARGM